MFMEKVISSNGEANNLPLFPPNLSGGAVPRLDPAELPESLPSISIEARREIIMRIFDAADGHFISTYVRTLVDFGFSHEDFIAGDVTAVYEKRHGELSVHEQKSLGGLYMQLQRKGVIEKTGGYRARNQGNASAIYRLKK
jgi:hypothetical protein